jgi:hypothetical protein
LLVRLARRFCPYNKIGRFMQIYAVLRSAVVWFWQWQAFCGAGMGFCVAFVFTELKNL